VETVTRRTSPAGISIWRWPFAQFTYRESLRGIETRLGAVGGKLCHMGFRTSVTRSTLADANESCDWRISADIAQTLIATARQLYAGDILGVDLDQSLYALDSTIMDLWLCDCRPRLSLPSYQPDPTPFPGRRPARPARWRPVRPNVFSW
jgi:hypothetical protein